MLASSLGYAEMTPVNGRINPLYPSVLNAYFQYYEQQRLYKDGLTVAKRLLTLQESQVGANSSELTPALTLYADALAKAGNLNESSKVHQRIAILEQAPMPKQTKH